MVQHRVAADTDQEGQQIDFVEVNGWDEFIQRTKRESRYDCVWRGQSDAKYPLRTTLERSPLTQYCHDPEDPFAIGKRKVGEWDNRWRGTRIDEYFEVLREIVSEVNALSGSNWNLEGRGVNDTESGSVFPFADTDRVAIANAAGAILRQNTLVNPNVYEMMVHARHHGFPSPLLDWTRSRYIALYFAMENVNNIIKEVERVAVYQLRSGEWNKCDDTFCVTCQEIRPAIKVVGLRPTNTPRHVKQQTVHTISYGLSLETEQIDEDQHEVSNMVTVYQPHGTRRYCRQCLDGIAQDVRHPFELVTEDQAEGERRAREGRIRKYIIPVTPEEQLRCLAELRHMNIGAYQLFGTEEALMRDCAVRHVVDKTWW